MDSALRRFRVGVDVVAVARVQRLCTRTALCARALQPAERAPDLSAERLAGLLALKEATAKALGVVPPPWREITVGHTHAGRPSVTLSPILAARGEVLDASLAHDADTAVAVVLVQLHARES